MSDGELRRDNDIDYLLARIPGIEILNPAKTYYYDYYETVIRAPLPSPEGIALGLAEDFAFTQTQTDRPVKFSFTGPFSLSRRIRNEAYASSGDLVRALAEVLNAEAHRLAGAGATLLQMDEPFLAGYPEDVGLAMEAINIVTAGVPVTWGLHVCYGNRYARPSWEGHYDFLFPAVLDADVDQLILEFARKGYDDLQLIRKYGWDRSLGLGVIDVKSEEIEGRGGGRGAHPSCPRRRAVRAPHRQPRLRATAPAGRHRPGQAAGDGRGHRRRPSRDLRRRLDPRRERGETPPATSRPDVGPEQP